MWNTFITTKKEKSDIFILEMVSDIAVHKKVFELVSYIVAVNSSEELYTMY